MYQHHMRCTITVDMAAAGILAGILILCHAPAVSGTQCFECRDVPKPFQCDSVTTCLSNYQCYVDQKVTSGGLILYDSGCRSPEACSITKRDTNGASIQQESATDIFTCQECCIGQYCNRQGCGIQDLDRSARGPYCFACHIQGGEDQCRTVAQCSSGEVCSIKDTSVNSVPQFQTECTSSTVCNHTTSSSSSLSPNCNRCCDGDFCNNICSQNILVVNGAFSAWSSWTPCSMTCGGGHQERSRTCSNPAPSNGGSDCIGNKTEHRLCTIANCPVDGRFTQWSNWSDCTVSCGGGGRQSMARTCTDPAPANGGAHCVGVSLRSRACGTGHCPVDGGYAPWSHWSVCSRTCGPDGRRSRRRLCKHPRPSHGGKDCVGERLEYGPCDQFIDCPVDGGVSRWGEWSACSNTCGGKGQHVRTRTCTNPVPAHGGKQCAEDLSQTWNCSTANHCTPADGLSEWSAWGACKATCGRHAQQTRTRHCLVTRNVQTDARQTHHHGDRCHGDKHDTRPCGSRQCPVDGGFTPWSAWGPCSVSCGVGHGVKTRTRECTHPVPAYGGAPCDGLHIDKHNCANNTDCPTTHDAGPGQWSTWSHCSTSCGLTGTQQRSRNCNGPHCPEMETQDCGRYICPDDCNCHGYTYYKAVHSCLRVLPGEFTWHDARAHCANDHADLVTIQTRRKDIEVHRLMEAQHSEHGAWIGLEGHAGQWYWKHHWHLHQSDVMYNNFLDNADLLGDPNNHCVAAQMSDRAHHVPYGWISRNCREKRAAVCERFADLV